MSDFKQYRRSQIAELRPYVPGEVFEKQVSISEADRANGSPKLGRYDRAQSQEPR